MDHVTQKHIAFHNRIIFIGFGGIGQACLPLFFRHLHLSPSQLTILTKDIHGAAVAQEYGVPLTQMCITKENYIEIITPLLQPGDFLLNLAVEVSSHDLMLLCRERQVLYLDTSSEPWDDYYYNFGAPLELRTNHALREKVLALKQTDNAPTAVITHGANPGLISHFMKQALLDLAAQHMNTIPNPQSPLEWAALAHTLEISAIHVAERDTQTALRAKKPNEFVNTWSVPGLIAEGLQPAELGWGTHERHWPQDGCRYHHGTSSSIYLNRPGICTQVKTWTPTLGEAHGFLITHAEAISISNFLTFSDERGLVYRPTVHYAYTPCPDAILSILELSSKNGVPQTNHHQLFSEITHGYDELGVLLMGNKTGAYWYGSQLSIEEARQCASHNNATSLQVVAGVLAGVLWAIENPERGVIEPEEMDHRYVLDVARPYLGKMAGYHTDWTPLKHGKNWHTKTIDATDPWQFINIRVD